MKPKKKPPNQPTKKIPEGTTQAVAQLKGKVMPVWCLGYPSLWTADVHLTP